MAIARNELLAKERAKMMKYDVLEINTIDLQKDIYVNGYGKLCENSC